MQQFNNNVISDSTFNLNYFNGMNEQETKEVLTQFSELQLQQAKKLLKKEYRSIFLSPFTFNGFGYCWRACLFCQARLALHHQS